MIYLYDLLGKKVLIFVLFVLFRRVYQNYQKKIKTMKFSSKTYYLWRNYSKKVWRFYVMVF